MIVVGVDPGSRRAGYAVLSADAQSVEIIEMGAWDLFKLAGSELGERLTLLHKLSAEFFRKHNPQVIGLENAVAYKNVSSALKLSEARGVIRLAAHQVLDQAALRLVELSPTEIKRSASGLGLGSKETVERALRLRFPRSHAFLNGGEKIAHDAFDAVAVAWAAKSRHRLNVLGVTKNVDAGS